MNVTIDRIAHRLTGDGFSWTREVLVLGVVLALLGTDLALLCEADVARSMSAAALHYWAP